MGYLMPQDYTKFILHSIGLEIEQTANYFRANYLEQKEHNPDFATELAKTILAIDKLIDAEINNFRWREVKPDPSEHNEFAQIAYNDMTFTLHQMFGTPIEEGGLKRISKSIIANIARAYKLFEKKIQNNAGPENNDTIVPDKSKLMEQTQVKLQWKGQKNQLYQVLRQLKIEYGLIGNSFNNLADFLIQNVIGFENSSKETIEKELKKKTPPRKEKRVSINPNEAE